MRRVVIWTLSLAITLGVPLYGNAQTSRPEATRAGSSAKTTAADKQFMMKAATGGKAEVELGQLAGQRGNSDAVKQFGQRMVTDHGKANEELTQLAQQKGVTLPSETDAKHKQLIQRLASLSGDEFDRAYIREMQRDHDADVKEFQRQAKTGHDPDLKAWAAKTLPVLQDHQRTVHQMTASLGSGSGRRASPGASSGGSASPATSSPSGSGSTSSPSTSSPGSSR